MDAKLIIPEGLRYTDGVNQNTVVIVDLAGQKRDGTSEGVVAHVTLGELGIDPEAQQTLPKPVLDQNKVADINASQQSPQEKAAALRKLLAEFDAAGKKYEELGGATLEDLILVATVEYLVREKGFVRTRNGDGPFVSATELTVTSFAAGPKGPPVYHVKGAAVWG